MEHRNPKTQRNSKSCLLKTKQKYENKKFVVNKQKNVISNPYGNKCWSIFDSYPSHAENIMNSPYVQRVNIKKNRNYLTYLTSVWLNGSTGIVKYQKFLHVLCPFMTIIVSTIYYPLYLSKIFLTVISPNPCSTYHFHKLVT